MDTKEAGKLGGIARTKNLTPKQRHDLAVRAINKRWNNTKPLVSEDLQDLQAEINKITSYTKPLVKTDPDEPTLAQKYAILVAFIESKGGDVDELIENALAGSSY